MSQPRRFHIEITGLTSLIMNSNAALLGPKEDKGRDKFQWERDHMMNATYRDQQGRLIIPAAALRKMAIAACSFITDKPKGASFKSFKPLIEAALFVEDDALLDVIPEKVVPHVAIVNLDPGKGPRGPRGPRCRPMVPMPWHAETDATLIDDAVTDDHLAKILDHGGRLVGLLDGRTIGYGRCEITVKRA